MVARLALRSALRIVSSAALKTASIGASRSASRIVVKSWGPRAGGRVEPSRARSRDAGGLDLGLGLEGLYWKLVRNVWSGYSNRMHCL